MAPIENRPSIGRIVHLNSGSNVFAAFISSVKDRDCVNLNVVNDATNAYKGRTEAMVMVENVYRGQSEDQWNWPPLVGTEK